MRTIQVSLDVFQAIWTNRHPEEQSEDDILRRLILKEKAVHPSRPESMNGVIKQPERDMRVEIGFHDPRYGVELPAGFEIFRTYKGREYRAQAVQGFWILGDKGYGTLNELNGALGVGSENAWKVWFYKDDQGRKRPLSDLRDQSRIIRRSASSGRFASVRR